MSPGIPHCTGPPWLCTNHWPVDGRYTARSVAVSPLKSDVTTGAADVVIDSCQPPLKLPVSPPTSSTTYRLHVPFGFEPLKVVRELAYGPPGAGAANASSIGGSPGS